jgi:plastocyanin
VNRLACSLGLGVALLGGTATLSRPVTSLAAAAKTHVVTIHGYTFIPRQFVINAGDRVTWVDMDVDQHSVVGDGNASGIMHSHPLGKRARYTVTFSKAGSFRYHCGFHAFMLGTVKIRVHTAA